METHSHTNDKLNCVLFTERVLRDAPVLPVEALALPGGVEGDVRRAGCRPDHAVARQHSGALSATQQPGLFGLCTVMMRLHA